MKYEFLGGKYLFKSWEETKAVREQKESLGGGKVEKRKFFYGAAFILVFVALATIFSLFYLKPRGEVVATVNNENITKDELYRAMLADGGRQVLERLINNRLIMAEGARLGIKVTDEEVDAEIEKVITDSFYGMSDYFFQTLEQFGLTEEALKKELKTEMVLRKIILAENHISDEQAREYFLLNQDRFNIPEQVAVRHILVDTEEEAEKVKLLLNSGEDFSELAREYSKDSLSAERGGNLGFIQRGEMVSEFEEVAFTLPLNQPSEPVETIYGFHIIEVLDRKAAQKVSFEDVAAQVKEMIAEEMIMEKMEKKINSLREQARIEYKLE